MDSWDEPPTYPPSLHPGRHEPPSLCFSGPSVLRAALLLVVFLAVGEPQKLTPFPRKVSLLGLCRVCSELQPATALVNISQLCPLLAGAWELLAEASQLFAQWFLGARNYPPGHQGLQIGF